MDFSIEKKISNFVESQFPQFYLEEGENFVLFVKAYYEWLESAYAVRTYYVLKTNNNVQITQLQYNNLSTHNQKLYNVKYDIITKDEYYVLVVNDKKHRTATAAAYDLQLQAVHQARNIFDLRDIDNTLEDFLEHFQQKYLYGIPFNTIINKRFLLKHILDVYRSKGSIQCYKLLFKLIYNQDIEIYLPGIDLLKPSDGSWVQLQYLEVTSNSDIETIVGKNIVGASSNTTAIIESYITEPINQNIISSLFISNVLPRGGTFIVGEKIIPLNSRANTQAVISAPTVVGSLDSLRIVNGGQDFSVGDIIKLTHKDINTKQITSKGIGGKLKVTSVSSVQGAIYFEIDKGGFGYTANSLIFIYNGQNDVTGMNASFDLAPLSYTRKLPFNTDLIIDYMNTTLNTTTFGFPTNPSANLTSGTIGSALAHQQRVFGTIAALTNIDSGENYTNSVSVFVRATQLASNNLPGTLTYTTTSNTITGVSTKFQGNTDTKIFSNGDVIYLQANSSNGNSIEYQVIKEVISNTELLMYAPPKHNSTNLAVYKTAPITLPSNYAVYEPVIFRSDGSVDGVNENITGTPRIGNNVITHATTIDSGKGYSDNEVVYAYLYNGIAPIAIVEGGTGYANGEQLIFTGGDTISAAYGFVTTDEDGVIVAAVLMNNGSNYNSVPKISVRTIAGHGAVLSTEVTEFNTHSKVTGKVVKAGVGKKEGYWSTSKSFLNADKYIQDSHFYQDYSYQIKAGSILNKYKGILYNTFHVAGSELFGEFYLQIEEETKSEILYDSRSVIYLSTNPPTWDSTLIRSATIHATMDLIP